MEKVYVMIFSVIVGSLGLISAALAFAGEGTKIKSSDVKMVGNVCDYPESAAVNCSFFSWVLLIAAQIIINVFSIYSCCRRHQHSNINSKRVNAASTCFTFSWVTFTCAFIMLMVANADSYLRHNPTRYDYCHVLKPGVFSGAGVLVLATVALGITCNFLLLPSDTSTPRPIPRPDPNPESTPTQPEDELNYNELMIEAGHDVLPSSLASPPNQNVLRKSNPHCKEILPS